MLRTEGLVTISTTVKISLLIDARDFALEIALKIAIAPAAEFVSTVQM
jgi:hypothetical protein